jgi:hypothetical protein
MNTPILITLSAFDAMIWSHNAVWIAIALGALIS